jgi:aspartyl protease family protein
MNRQDPVAERVRLGRWMIFATWVGVLVLLTLGFSEWLEYDYNPNRDPASGEGARSGEVVLVRNRGGHYVASGVINGQPVVFLVDTGASDVSVPGELARELGLPRGAPLAMQTAGGLVTGYATRLDSVRLGDIELKDVRASINPHAGDLEVLLGMSFLRQLELVQRGDRLTLRQYSSGG